jgi:hypothetical protein
MCASKSGNGGTAQMSDDDLLVRITVAAENIALEKAAVLVEMCTHPEVRGHTILATAIRAQKHQLRKDHHDDEVRQIRESIPS